jgi:hypothetical protein
MSSARSQRDRRGDVGDGEHEIIQTIDHRRIVAVRCYP